MSASTGVEVTAFRVLNRSAWGLFAVLLSGCATCPDPGIVTVPEYVPVPEALLQAYPCGQEPILTNGDLLAAYADCLEANAKYGADRTAIRTLARPIP